MPYLVLIFTFFLILILQISIGSGILTLVKRFTYSPSFYFCFLAFSTFANIRTLLFTNLRTCSLTDKKYITNSASIYYRSQVTSSVTSSPAAAVVRSLIPTAWVGSKASPSPTTRLQSVHICKIRINKRRIDEAKHQNINSQISRSLYSLTDNSSLMQYCKSLTNLSHVLAGIQKYVLVAPNNLQTYTYTYWLAITIDVVVTELAGLARVLISLPPWLSIGILILTQGCYKCSKFCKNVVDIVAVSGRNLRLRRQSPLKRKREKFYCYYRYSILKIDLSMIDLVGSWDYCGPFGARGPDGNSTGHYG